MNLSSADRPADGPLADGHLANVTGYGSNNVDNTSASDNDQGTGGNSPTDEWSDGLDDRDSSSIRVQGSAGHITVSGELDFDSAERFRAALNEATIPNLPELVVDMSKVSFMDSSGLRELASMRSTGVKITIENASECVRTLLRVTRMDEVFTVA